MSQLKSLQDWNIQNLSLYIAEIIEKESGNRLGVNQLPMVMNRLKQRLLSLGNLSANQYMKHFQMNQTEELDHLVSLLTTHHTFFFREFSHFDFIIQSIPKIIQAVKARGDNTIRVYSAACSKGQEVYSLAMALNKHIPTSSGIKYHIQGSDIDSECIRIAQNGVYLYDEIKTIPQVYLSNNWQRGTGDISNYARVKNHLKKNCSFEVKNILADKNKNSKEKYDLILCRNVFIYFEQESITKVVNKFKTQLHPDGLLITGLSESLSNTPVEAHHLAPSIYVFNKNNIFKSDSFKQGQVDLKKKIRVFSVDDSPSILKLLTKIFSSDPDFELVGTASNGKEAEIKTKNLEYDIMTLDIHMPEMDGIQYLQQNFGPSHSKVIMISSASREDMNFSQKALKLGASDFVEKPSLNNLKKRSEEIRNKIKMVLNTSEENTTNTHIKAENSGSIDIQFKNSFLIQKPENKCRMFFSSSFNVHKLNSILNSLKDSQPAVVIFTTKDHIQSLNEKISSKNEIIRWRKSSNLQPNKVYLATTEEDFSTIKLSLLTKMLSISVFSDFKFDKSLDHFFPRGSQVLVEDKEIIDQELKNKATDIFPWTSFAHIGTEYLAND